MRSLCERPLWTCMKIPQGSFYINSPERFSRNPWFFTKAIHFFKKPCRFFVKNPQEFSHNSLEEFCENPWIFQMNRQTALRMLFHYIILGSWLLSYQVQLNSNKFWYCTCMCIYVECFASHIHTYIHTVNS